jgi:hypothetical protein
MKSEVAVYSSTLKRVEYGFLGHSNDRLSIREALIRSSYTRLVTGKTFVKGSFQGSTNPINLGGHHVIRLQNYPSDIHKTF